MSSCKRKEHQKNNLVFTLLSVWLCSPRRGGGVVRVLFSVLLAVSLSVASIVLNAAPITIPLTAVSQIAPGAPQQPDETLDAFRARRLLEQLATLGLASDAGLVLARFPIEPSTQELATVCPVPLPKAAHTDATEAQVNLGPQSTVTFNLDSLRNLSVQFDLAGELHATTSAWVQWGQAIPFVGNCDKIATDHGTITVHLPFALRFSTNVQLTPQFDDQLLVFVVDKLAVADGSLDLGSGWINPDFGGASLTDAVIKAFEDDLLGRMRAKGLQQFTGNIARLNNRFAGRDVSGNLDPAIEPFNGITTFPLLTDPAQSETATALARDLNIGNRLVQLFDARGGNILLQLLVLDEAGRKQYLAELGSGVLCEALLARYEATTAPQTPLYTLDTNNNCVAADPFGVDRGRYFLDGACATEVAFRPTPAQEFCAATLGTPAKRVLGNAAAWVPDAGQVNDVLPQIASRKWTALQSTRLNVGVLANDNVFVPYTKLFNFKQTTTIPDAPPCELEMRVYKKDIRAAGLRPLLAIHGGTWDSRGFSWVGLEATVAQFTNRGFIVFAPFYRLVGTDDANDACQGAGWREVVADVEEALQWVNDYGSALGAASQPVTVFGQSAGAHLAAWLTATRSADVERALLYYPPSDVLDFLRGVAPGGRYATFNAFGVNALARLFGARQGAREIHLDRINVAGANGNTRVDQWLEWVPDEAIDWSVVDWRQPSIYLRRCAALTQTDLGSIDPGNIPRPFIDCVKRELGEFLMANAFHQRVFASSPPLFVAHGIADDLVPWQQSVGLCQARAAAPVQADPAGTHTVVACGGSSRAHLVEGAGHALDLGLCAGSLCPAGAPGSLTRLAVSETLLAGLDWINVPVAQAPAVQSDSTRLARRGGGGGLITLETLTGLLLFFVMIWRRPGGFTPVVFSKAAKNWIRLRGNDA